MITQQRSARIKNATRPSVVMTKRVTASDRTVRLFHSALALYLLPVLLVVLAVGGIGLLILGCGRLSTGLVRGLLG